jgi:lipopolysaccharide assembly outer membrane protein LptD (OstA)
MRHLKGSVVIETDSMVLRTDEADYNEDTSELTTRGAVNIKLK